MQQYTSLLARIFLSGIFLYAGVNKIFNFEKTQGYMQSQGVPGFLIIPTIIILVGGGISLLLGYKARWGALFLIGFLIPTTLIFHPFPEEINSFLKNLALIGGLLMIYSAGSGSFSLDEKLK